MEAILVGILAVSLVYLITTYENLEDKSTIEGLEDKVDFLENALGQKNLEYEWLSEITDYYIAYGLDRNTIDDDWECVKWKQILVFANLKYPQLSNQAQGMMEKECRNKEIKTPVDHTQEILPSEIVNQEFTIRVSQNLEGSELTIWGNSLKSHSKVSGAIYAGNIDELKIVHAFSLVSDENGSYKQIIETPSYDPKWKEGSYTISVSSDKEQKQMRFTR